MGVPPEWRKFLFNWLSGRCASRGVPSPSFFAQLPTDYLAGGFDVVLLDGMQELAVVKATESYRSGQSIIDRMVGIATAHLVSQSDDNQVANNSTGEIVAGRLLVLCFDNPYCVPRNKAFREASRDVSNESKVAAATSSTGQNSTDTKATPTDVILNSTSFATIIERAATEKACLARLEYGLAASPVECEHMEREIKMSFDPLRHFIIDTHAFPADGSQIWRNTVLSWQLKRLLTEGLMTMPVPVHKQLLIDEGFLIDEAGYAKLATQMLHDHGFDDGHHSPFEQAALVSNLFRSCTERILVGSDETPGRLPSTGLGESDHKIPYYVQRTLPLGLPRAPGSSKARYLVKCQDTDVLWMLLLHVSNLINPVTGNVDDVEVWLDSQTPNDRAQHISRPYRFVNVVALWRELIAALVEEFPTLKNPLESLVALVFCNGNDYVESFATPLKIGPTTMWNLFAETLAFTANRQTFPSFSTPGKRDKVSPKFPRELRGVLDDWVTVTETTTVASMTGTALSHRVLALRQRPALAYFYALMQRSPLVTSLSRQVRVNARAPRDGLPFMTNHEALLETIGQLSQLAAAKADTMNYTAPLLHIPTVPAMKARLARINWTIDYYLNGWKTTAYETNWFDHDGETSRHGWSATDVTDTPECSPVSQYLYAKYEAPHCTGPLSAPVYPRFRFLKPCLSSEVSSRPVY